jgi:uncharacterized protein (TIGR03435 family)
MLIWIAAVHPSLPGTLLAQVPTAQDSFEVASVKPSPAGAARFPGRSFLPGGRFTANNLTLRALIQIAYDVPPVRISGGSNVLDSGTYDIDAKAEDSAAQAPQLKRMVQTLLADRFNLSLHRETRELLAYLLVAAKGGPKLQKAEERDCPDIVDGDALLRGTLCHFLVGGPQTGWSGRTISMQDLADALTVRVNRSVVDQTGIKGSFDIKTTGWSLGTGDADGARQAAESNTPSLLTVLEEQLGLRLESRKAPVEILIVDRAEKPAAN